MRFWVMVRATKDSEEAKDSGVEFTPELREREERLRAQVAKSAAH